MKKHSYFYRNSLSIVFLSLFIFTLTAQAISGWKTYNKELLQDYQQTIGFVGYLRSGHFISATFENFESEFLQMTLYVLLIIGLRQKGSAESKSLDEKEEVDREPVAGPDAPLPVKKGGWWLKLYSSSLSIAFGILFIASWTMHFYGSWKDFNTEQLLDGKPMVGAISFFTNPRFWFETFQNWQSEFLSVFAIVFLTIYLRQKGSPESKPVDAPHSETGK